MARPKLSKLNSSPEPESTMVGFRLDPESFMELTQRSIQQGTSVHEQARQCLFQALHQRSPEENLVEVVTGLYQEISQIRNDIATAMQALLVTFGNVDVKLAEDWIKRSFP